LTRPSTSYFSAVTAKQDVDARLKAGHDEVNMRASPYSNIKQS
jgi:hypothetical protein